MRNSLLDGSTKFFAPINEFHRANKPNNNGNVVSYDHSNSRLTIVPVSAISNPGHHQRTECRPGRRAITRWVTASRREMRASKNLTTLLNDALNEPVTITENGQRAEIAKREAVIK